MGNKQENHLSRRRGVVVVWTAAMMTTLLGFAALTIDVGYMYVVRTQLQKAADAAALAGASAYIEDAGLTQGQGDIIHLARARAQHASYLNVTAGKPTILSTNDITVGRHDFDNPQAPLDTNGRWNAVEVVVRRTTGSENGSVGLFFAGIFGVYKTDIIARARAVANDRLLGYRSNIGGAGLAPFTINLNIYASEVANGSDNFSYDNGVKPFGDGIREVTLYPWKWTELPDEGDYNDGSGNFGTLTIGTGNEGTAELEEQIRTGVTAEQLETQFGTSLLIFDTENDDEELPEYWCPGNPGMSVGMRDTLEAKIGDIIGFFLHRTLIDNGSNASYHVTSIRYGRIVDVQITGNPEDRSLTIQPVAYTGPGILVTNSTGSTDGQVNRLVLVQ